MATNIDEMDQESGYGTTLIGGCGGVSLHKQSHRKSFLAVVLNRFGGNGLYIFDEQEAVFSPMRMMTLLSETDELIKLIISTHSTILMAY